MLWSRPYDDSLLWKAPLMGSIIYILLTFSLSRLGRRWHPLVHLLIAISWLITGEIIFTAMTMK
jgi:hypothetical protein